MNYFVSTVLPWIIELFFGVAVPVYIVYSTVAFIRDGIYAKQEKRPRTKKNNVMFYIAMLLLTIYLGLFVTFIMYFMGK